MNLFRIALRPAVLVAWALLASAGSASAQGAGYRTLTTAMDGPSERLRDSLERKAKVKHLERCAERLPGACLRRFH